MAPEDLDGNDPGAKRLADLAERLKAVRGQGKDVRENDAPPSQLGIAMRLVSELVAAVLVGGGIGWALDRVLGTAPFLFIVMFMVGVAAGIMNVIRTARQLNADALKKTGGS
jgi:ATP synthase protein I